MLLASSKLPYGRRPDLTRAWNPLQIPMIKPPRSMNLSMAARTFSLSKMLTINLADPSGSSAAEKPPAKKDNVSFFDIVNHGVNRLDNRFFIQCYKWY